MYYREREGEERERERERENGVKAHVIFFVLACGLSHTRSVLTV